MKKTILSILVVLVLTISFCNDSSTKLYPFLGYASFHDAINLKNSIILGAGINQPIAENLRINLAGGYIPSELKTTGQSMPVFYGYISEELLLPKLCCGATPFLMAGLSVFAYDNKIDNGIEIGLGLYTLTKKSIENKFELKARYNPGDKASDFIAIFSLGFIPLTNKEEKPIVEKKEELIIAKQETIPEKQEKPKELVVVVEEEKKAEIVPTIKDEPKTIIEEPKIEETKQETPTTIITTKKETKMVFDNDKRIVLDRFFYNSSFIGVPGEESIKKAEQILQQNPELKALITGYANEHEEIKELALKRAENVKQVLIKNNNITANRVSTNSGGTKPETDNNYLNRRVEINFYTEK